MGHHVTSLNGLTGNLTSNDLALANVTVATGTTTAFSTDVTGDTVNRLAIDGSGKHTWGSGSATGDTTLYRDSANVLKTDDAFTATGAITGGAGAAITGAITATTTVTAGTGLVATTGGVTATAGDITATDGNVLISTIGKGLQVKTGSNARFGTLTLNGATPVVVNNTSITADTGIFLTVKTVGGTPAFSWVSARSAGVSFSVTGTASDTSVLNWFLVEPIA